MNGRIDLAQAEAVMGIIGARSQAALKSQEALCWPAAPAALSGMRRKRLLQLIAGVEAYIDYPDEIDEYEATSTLLEGLDQRCLRTLRDAADERSARILRHGLRVALYGSPNTGKSTLFNALLKRGTRHCNRYTRNDARRAGRQLQPERLSGNCCWIPPAYARVSDVVERIGVQRTRQVIENADVALLMIDATKPLNDSEERHLLTADMQCPCAVLVNKEDKPPVITVKPKSAPKPIIRAVFYPFPP